MVRLYIILYYIILYYIIYYVYIYIYEYIYIYMTGFKRTISVSEGSRGNLDDFVLFRVLCWVSG